MTKCQFCQYSSSGDSDSENGSRHLEVGNINFLYIKYYVQQILYCKQFWQSSACKLARNQRVDAFGSCGKHLQGPCCVKQARS